MTGITKHLSTQIYHTLLLPIPKFTSATTVFDYHPINLCTTAYKIISKLLANHLKRVLHKCIIENQSALLPSCHVGDNVIMALECAKYLMSSKRKASLGCP